MTGAPTSDSTPSDATTSNRAVGDSADGERTDAEPVDTDVAAARIRDRAAEIREREVETALAKLDARGDLSEDDREAVEALADRLVARLIAVPAEGLQAAADDEADDESGRAAETALELFG
ncbi:glutamyl-tRNA reductase [Halosimplex sp. TS25]|uniref:glutamyl-tRNA reductase n=1 Tax=Halosimplex rarum TaxID=3396619 RepID=UPI0039E9CDA4